MVGVTRRKQSAVILGSLLGLAGLLWSALVPQEAFASPEIKVGYVDLQKALAGSKLGADAQKKYEAEVKKAQSEVDAKKSELEKLKDAYKSQEKSLTDAAKQSKQEDILSREKDLKRSFQDSKEKLQRENQLLVGDLVRKLRTVVDAVGKSEGFTIILERSSQSVLYADNKIDITDTVIKKFDESK